MTAATQNVEECLRSETARLMLANSEFLLLFNQAATDGRSWRNSCISLTPSWATSPMPNPATACSASAAPWCPSPTPFPGTPSSTGSCPLRRGKSKMASKNESHRETQITGPLTLGSLFDGIGVFPLAASRHGIVPRWASEIEKAPISITKRHFPHMEHLETLRNWTAGPSPPSTSSPLAHPARTSQRWETAQVWQGPSPACSIRRSELSKK